MSLSRPQAKNPATRFMSWKGGAEDIGTKDKPKFVGGQLTWYDKASEENKEVALPFTFIVLDELNTITGFSEGDHSGFWSNEVRDLQTGELIVRTKAGIRARGLYGQISDSIKSKGAKYAKSVYIAFKDETGELVIGNIKFTGASLTAWIEFEKRYNVEKCAVTITDKPQLGKKGRTTYFMPVFEAINMNENTKTEARNLDDELQAYLDSYLLRKPDVDAGTTVVEDDDNDEDIHNVKGLDDVGEVEIEDVDEPTDESPKQSNVKDVSF